MSLPEFATPEKTRDFTSKTGQGLPDAAFCQLGRTGLSVSRLGFGTYRCHAEDETHKAALKNALDAGCNLIDTSANYTDGMAEVLIGDVLNAVVVWEGNDRGQYVIVSKVGYLQGENMDIARERENAGNPFPEVVKYQDDMWHCIHPAFIEDQVTRSLARMHLDTLDVYLLHNPEYFLMHARQQGYDMATAEKQFYNRLRRAFVQMEKLVGDGLIRWYGVSSNSFPLPADDPAHVSLAKMWDAYADACLQLGKTPDSGHFAAIQLPCNWLETGAMENKNNTFKNEPLTVLQLADKLNIGVLANRPLNAIRDNRLVRLASYGAEPGVDYRTQFATEIEQLEQTEDELVSYVARDNLNIQNVGNAFRESLQISLHLRKLSQFEMDISTFRQLMTQRILPLLDFGKKVLREKAPPEVQPEIRTMLDNYESHVNSAAEAWRLVLDSRNIGNLSHHIHTFDAQHPQWQPLPLSQKALLTLLQEKNLHAVLIGMRTPAYVSDALAALRQV